jgi:membrane-bound acyltransferase YfiQ involved in biofilm formation
MIYRFKIPLVLFLGGMIFQLLGAWAKITHHAYADKLLAIGFLTQCIGLFIAIFILLGTRKKN